MNPFILDSLGSASQHLSVLIILIDLVQTSLSLQLCLDEFWFLEVLDGICPRNFSKLHYPTFFGILYNWSVCLLGGKVGRKALSDHSLAHLNFLNVLPCWKPDRLT